MEFQSAPQNPVETGPATGQNFAVQKPPAAVGQTQTGQIPPKPRRKIVFFLILILILSLIFAAGYLFLSFKKPPADADIVAKVGSQKIAISETNEFANKCKVSQKEAVGYLVDNLVLSQWAVDENVSVSDKEQKVEEERISGRPPVIPCNTVRAKVNLLREKLSQSAVGFREGKFIVINFDRYNPSSFILSPEATPPADIEKLREEERTYADNLARSIYEDLKANKLTFEEAIEKVNQDSRVGKNSFYATSPKSGVFSALDYIEKKGLLYNDLIREKVDALSEGGFSEPFVQQINIRGMDPSLEPQYVDVRWVIAKVDRIEKGSQGTTENLLDEVRNKYRAKIYLR